MTIRLTFNTINFVLDVKHGVSRVDSHLERCACQRFDEQVHAVLVERVEVVPQRANEQHRVLQSTFTGGLGERKGESIARNLQLAAPVG